ncbi:MAG: 4-hydroxy-tetrahydrodipicolinate reductase [Candidatus Sericytochromatia bacterium]
MKRVLLTGSTGKMGLECVKTLFNSDEFELVGVIGNTKFLGEDIGAHTLGKPINLIVSNDFDKVFEETKPDILLDVTNGFVAYDLMKKALLNGVSCVTGSTGFDEKQLQDLKKITEEKNLTCLVIPNFSIGAVLMMKFAQEAGKYFDNAEIIELHHEKKKDSPSGTALKTAEMIAKNNKKYNQGLPESEDKIEGCRGGTLENINIHSVRLPGFVATQEVIFGGLGQSLIIKHQTIGRDAYMPGVIFSLKKCVELSGYIYGLENLI